MKDRISDGLRFEICVDSIAGVIAARDAGANRVELCASLIEGGITPSLGMIRRARQVKSIGLHVIIRPRGGDFLYAPEEMQLMEADIDAAKAAGANGIVFGMLDRDANIDVAADRAADRPGAARVGHVPPRLRHDARSVRGSGDIGRTRRRPRTHLRAGADRARRCRHRSPRWSRPPAIASSSCPAAASRRATRPGSWR